MSEFWNDVSVSVSGQDINAMLDNWHYLTIVALREDEQIEDLTPPTDSKFVPHVLSAFDSEWIIHYWVGTDKVESVMSASVGDLHTGFTEFDDGTDTANAAKLARSMVHYAYLKKWPGVIISEGTDFMRWLAWATCESYGIKSVGFSPSGDDHSKRERCEDLLLGFKDQPVIVPSISLSVGSTGQGLEED